MASPVMDYAPFPLPRQHSLLINPVSRIKAMSPMNTVAIPMVITNQGEMLDMCSILQSSLFQLPAGRTASAGLPERQRSVFRIIHHPVADAGLCDDIAGFGRIFFQLTPDVGHIYP